MDKFLDKLFCEFGNDLKSIEYKTAKPDNNENIVYEKLVKALDANQIALVDELILAMAENRHDECYTSFVSGLKFGLKLFELNRSK